MNTNEDAYQRLTIAADYAFYKFLVISDEISNGERGYYPPMFWAWAEYEELLIAVQSAGADAYRAINLSPPPNSPPCKAISGECDMAIMGGACPICGARRDYERLPR